MGLSEKHHYIQYTQLHRLHTLYTYTNMNHIQIRYVYIYIYDQICITYIYIYILYHITHQLSQPLSFCECFSGRYMDQSTCSSPAVLKKGMVFLGEMGSQGSKDQPQISRVQISMAFFDRKNLYKSFSILPQTCGKIGP